MHKTALAIETPHDNPLEDRNYLTPPEAHRLIEAASKQGRQGKRDKLLLLLAYRHGLRVSELCDLRWSDFDFEATTGATLTVRRLKGSRASKHSLDRDEALMLRAWRQDHGFDRFLFLSERGAPLSVDMVQRVIRRAGVAAGLGPNVHPHMLRHAAGYSLAEAGHGIHAIALHLGHKNIQNTMHYAERSAVALASVRVR